MKKGRTRGFTLIEVTLAIVIGIIMIAGATLIYNQAKTSAGNSRAQAKVVSLQQLVEEYAAQSQGLYPNSLTIVQALWSRKRPDDWNKSPWGGLVGSSFTPTTAYGVGSWSTATMSATTLGKAGILSAPQQTAAQAAAANAITNATPTESGALSYDYDDNNATFSYKQDIMTNTVRLVKGYAVFIADQQGRIPNFVTGGRAN